MSGRRPVSQGGPGCCCGRQCGGRGGADGGPGGEAPCGGRGCSLLSAFPPRRPHSRRFVPVCLVRAEAGPRRQCRRARDPPHAPGSASVWLRSGRRAARLAVSAAPSVLSGPGCTTQREPPGFGKRAEEAAAVCVGWKGRVAAVPPPPSPARSRVAPLEGMGWDRRVRTGEERSCRVCGLVL